MLMAMYMLMVYSQNSVSYIYETGTSNPVLFSQPQTRRIYGGSIINVSFEGSNVLRKQSSKMQWPRLVTCGKSRCRHATH